MALGAGNDETQRVGVSDEAKLAVTFVAGLGSFAAAGVIDGVAGRMVGETPVLSARGIGRARLRLAAFAMRPHGTRRRREIATWDLPASASGDFVREFVADRLRNAPAVCVVASTAGHQTCPPSAKRRARGTAWIRYRRPGG